MMECKPFFCLEEWLLLMTFQKFFRILGLWVEVITKGKKVSVHVVAVEAATEETPLGENKHKILWWQDTQVWEFAPFPYPQWFAPGW